MRYIKTFSLLSFLFLFSGCVATSTSPPKQLYTKHNLWGADSEADVLELTCINFKSQSSYAATWDQFQPHKGTNKILVPAGTPVKDVTTSKVINLRAATTDEQVDGDFVFFTTVNDGQKYRLKMNPRWHSPKDIDHCKDAVLSPLTFSQLTEGLSEKEIEAIKKGAVEKGMSKKAVLISFGHPPESRTKSTTENRWFYWRTRYANDYVCFENDQVTGINCDR